MSALEFFTAIAEDSELTPTDKNYKVYVDQVDPEAGIPWIYSMANHQPDDSGQWIFVTESNLETMPRSGFSKSALLGSWIKITTKNKKKQGKFYFYHLTEDEMIRFIELHNTKKLKLAYPGHFYVFPFFMKRVQP